MQLWPSDILRIIRSVRGAPATPPHVDQAAKDVESAARRLEEASAANTTAAVELAESVKEATKALRESVR